MAGWDDYAAALKFRNLIEQIATTQAQKVMPADFTAQVVEIDVPNLIAAVKQAGDDGLLMAKFSPSLQPRTIGCFVRISGYPGNYYISAILDEAGINQVYEETTQQALDSANQALELVATDELPPTTAPVVLMSPLGYNGVVLKWTAVPNADPVKYRVLFDKVSPPTQVLTDTVGLVTSTSQLPNGELLDSTQVYYAVVIPHDADGDGPVSAEVSGGPVVVPADAVSEDILVANEIFSREGYFGSISVNQLETGSLTATIDITTGHIQVGDIVIDQQNGIRIPLANDGQILFPHDGTDAIFEKVNIHATSATFDDNVNILGQDNLLSGTLKLLGTVPPPSLPPVLASIYKSTPEVTLSSGDAGYAGLGDNGTSWQTSKLTAFTRVGFSMPGGLQGGNWNATLQVYNINKATGAVAGVYSVVVSIYSYGQVLNTMPAPGATTPTLAGFHSTDTRSVFILYCPTFSYKNYAGSTITTAAHYQVIVVNNTTGAVMYNWTWSTYASWTFPGIYTDGINIWVGATNKGNLQVYFYRYNLDGSGGVNVAISPTQHNANWSGLYVGNGDFGSQRYILTYTSGSMHVFDSTGAIQNSEVWARANNEAVRGIVYGSDGRFYTHSTLSKIWTYSLQRSSVSHNVKYTWYDSIGTVHESLASPSLVVTQGSRQYLQVITQPPPNGGNVDDPTTVRVYVDNHQQADIPAGVTTVLYEIPSTGLGDAPLSDGFAALGGHGSFESSLKAAARVQQITITGAPSGGSFALVYAGSSTAAIAFNATATTVQTTLNNLLTTLGAGSVVVGGGPGPGTPWIVSFSNASPAQLGSVSSLTGGLAPSIDISDGTPVTQFQGDGTWHLSNLTGAIIPYAGVAAPDGFLLCDGSAVSRITYADLYRVISTTYGAGDGSTTFNVPDLRGRTVVGVNPGDVEFDTLGEKYGNKLLQAHNHGGPSHIHGLIIQYQTDVPSSGTGNRLTDAGSNNAAGGGGTTATANSNAGGTGATTTSGSGSSQNIQPSIALNYLIKV